MENNSNKNLIYPNDLAKLYADGIKNYIQFQSITFESAKNIIAEDKTYIQVKSITNNVITLELGPELNLSDGHNWTAVSTLSGRSSSKGFLDTVTNTTAKLAGIVGESALVNILGKITSTLSLGSIDPNIVQNEWIFSNGQTLINPNTTLIYGDTDPRTINLTYIMRPTDEIEAKVIINIIDRFKQSSRGVSTDGGIKFPNMWYIKTSSEPLNILLESGEEDVNDSTINFGLPFACTNVGTNIATNYMYHNKYPNQITLVLQFMEIKPRYKRKSDVRPENSVIYNVR